MIVLELLAHLFIEIFIEVVVEAVFWLLGGAADLVFGTLPRYVIALILKRPPN